MVTVEAVKVGAGAITKLKSLELAKNIVRKNDKTPERIHVAQHAGYKLSNMALFSCFSVDNHIWAKLFSGMFP